MASADSNLLWLIATILIVSLVEIVYYFRVVNGLYFKKSTTEFEVHKPRWNAAIAMIVLALAVVLVGVYPNIVYGFFENAANSLMDRANYIHQVLPDIVMN